MLRGSEKQNQTSSAERQRALYDRMFEVTPASLVDVYAREYARLYIALPMFEGIPLRGANVLDVACGTGALTEYLLNEGAMVSGLDISPNVIADYARMFPRARAVCCSVFDTQFPAESFDVVCVGGALHHFHPDLQKALDELYRILKPGGFLCFSEPHAGSLPDVARKLWYRFDRKYFEENEASIAAEKLHAANGDRFELVSHKYGGNIAYLLVLMGFFLRIPHKARPYYAPMCLKVEPLLTPLQVKQLSFFVIGQWRKRFA